MDEHILKCLDSIEISNNNIFNGTIFICKENPNSNPCQNCLTCKLVILKNFSVSLLNHMPDNDVINFITKCSKTDSHSELTGILQHILYPLKAKDRLYSLSRNVPSLNTDLSDFSIKNFAIDKAQLDYVTHRISNWISLQPDTFRIQFIISLLSHIKLAVLSEIYYSISVNRNSSKDPINYSTTSNEIISDPETISQAMTQFPDNHIHENRPPERSADSAVDFISNLPVHISKRIINFLDDKSLRICSNICENWRQIVYQVRREDLANSKIQKQAMMLQSQKDESQSVSTAPADPRFARDTNVRVPQLEPHTHKIIYINNVMPAHNMNKDIYPIDNANELELVNSRKVFSMDIAYQNIMTKKLIIEERNIFCGSYSVMIILESQSRNRDPLRTISYNGGLLVAVSGTNKIIQFLDKRGIQNEMMKNRIRGHAGSIKVVKFINKPNKKSSGKRTYDSHNNICQEDAEILSGSYDTTIRRWDTFTGKCLKIYIGHSGTISDIDAGEEIFASGSFDGTCKLWRYDEKNCFATMRHKHPITAVAISDKICVSGDSLGLIKVWNIQNGVYIKSLSGHFKEISAIRLDSWHILSASLDNFVMLWSTVGEFDTCIGNFHHPKSVLSMEFQFLRAVTGCADGKIRIWNILNGSCIRVIRGNSRSDPIFNLVVKDDTIIINTVSNILVLNFEPIDWVYENDKNNRANKTLSSVNSSENKQPINKRNNFRHIAQRCERSRLAGNIDPRIFITPNIEGLEISSKSLLSNPEFNYVRLFENGIPLSRSTAWIVSPSFNKSLSHSMKPSPCKLKDSVDSIEENNVATELRDNLVSSTSVSQSTRRISYGFERQDHLFIDTDLQEIKQTLRNHIRSPPQISADAMPEFIKTMVSQLKTSNLTGRPVSAFSLNRSVRPSSGPSKIDSKSKVGVEEIKTVVSPLTQQTVRDLTDTINFQSHFKNQINQPVNDENILKPLFSSNFKTSNNSIGQSKFGSFFLPPDYRKRLTEKKLEFDQRHRTNADHQLSNDNVDSSKKPKCKLVVNNLNLQTFENSQQCLDQMEKQQVKYDLEHKLKIDHEYHLKWLKRATESPNLTFEKDSLMKRPRSAKI